MLGLSHSREEKPKLICLTDPSRRLLPPSQLVEDVAVFSQKTVYNILQKSVMEWTKIWCLGLGHISKKWNRDPEMCDPDVYSREAGMKPLPTYGKLS